MSSSFNIYNAHFGLVERPFSLVPDPDFLFWSKNHTRAFAMLEYGILTRAPITLITGEVGAGKTTLLHHLLRSVEDDIRIGMISNAHGDRGELVRWVLQALGQEAPENDSYVKLFAQFQAYLIEEYAAGHRVILIFDEAQNLSRESLEELRMFTNINANKDELLQLILVGQPELRDTVLKPDLQQFAQRVSSAFHLVAMDEATVSTYIDHRMQIAGASEQVFRKGAREIIYAQTGGIPRLVNQLCDLCLVYAFTDGQQKVTEQVVNNVIADGVFFSSRAQDPLQLKQEPRAEAD